MSTAPGSAPGLAAPLDPATVAPRDPADVPRALDIRDVTVRYGDLTAVGPVSLAVPSGAWHCIIGPNGAGKSSLLRAAAGLVEFSGTVEVKGVDVAQARVRERARLAALVPQHPVMPADMALADYVMLGRTAHIPAFRSETPSDRAAVSEALERMDLVELAGRRLSQLSGGERQRAILARALAQQSPVLLLDEPTTSLDIGHAQSMLEVIDSLRRDQALTVLSTMHDLTLAAAFSDELIALDHGAIIARGVPSGVLTEKMVTDCYEATVRVIATSPGRVAVIPVRGPTPA